MLTVPQLAMLHTVDTLEVRRNRTRDGWLINYRPATGVQNRILDALLAKGTIKVQPHLVKISGRNDLVEIQLAVRS
jgi:hypothetical protein